MRQPEDEKGNPTDNPTGEQSGLRCDFRDNVVIGNKPTGSSAPGKSDIGYKYGNEGEVVSSDGDFAKALQDFIYGKTAGDDKIQQS